jgi:excinuclease ABC subunit A
MVEGVGRNTLFLFDEPTAGLHFDDVVKLVECFRKLTEKGNSVVVAEHNMEFVKYADYVIDLGPGPGRRGGKVIARGTPERIVMSKASKTGAALKAYLNSARRTEQVALRASAKVETV